MQGLAPNCNKERVKREGIFLVEIDNWKFLSEFQKCTKLSPRNAASAVHGSIAHHFQFGNRCLSVRDWLNKM